MSKEELLDAIAQEKKDIENLLSPNNLMLKEETEHALKLAKFRLTFYTKKLKKNYGE